MKKSLQLLIAFLFITNILSAQSLRKVLIEHFTQASCPPCAAVNPIIDPIMDRNSAKVTRISHQVSWPGVDPMNKDNPGDVANRVKYYGVTGVPDVYIDSYSSGNPTVTITDETIQNASDISSPYEISITNKILPDYNSIEINVTVKLTGTLIGKPMLRVAALEKIISWSTPPGSNGEKVFYHVLKKFIPSATGTSLDDINQTGQSKTFTFTYKFDKLYDFKNLETAAFIQDDNTKQIFQSENAAVEYIASPGVDVAIKLSNPTGVFGDSIICGNSTAPIVKVINTGNKSITSLDFTYSVNGGPSSSYKWTGKIDYLKETNITLPAISFIGLKGANQLKLEISSVNNVPDYNPINNISDLTFYSAPSTTLASTFELKQILQPTLLSFVIRDDKNQIVLQDGPFTTSATKTYTLNLDQDRCYKVYSTNSGTSLNGTYSIFDNQKNLILLQRIIGLGTVDRDFSTYSQVTATHDVVNNPAFTISPNPANQNITIRYSTDKTELNTIRIINISGNTILSKELRSNSGLNTFNLDINSISEGIYFVSLKSGNGMKTTKLIVR